MPQTEGVVNAQPTRKPSPLPQNIDSGRLLLAMQSALAILHPSEKLTVRWHDQQPMTGEIRANGNQQDD